MNNLIWQRLPALPITLMAIMALTRFHHFGSALSLPDASLAIFFMAGLLCRKPLFFGVLLAEAALIDYVAISQLNVSDFCISPAYLFLIPTYAAMWLAGRFASVWLAQGKPAMLKAFGVAAAATVLAFVISNTSFYLLSDQIADRSWEQFVSQFGRYFPAYFSATLIYIGFALAGINIWQNLKKFAWFQSHLSN